MAERAKDVIEEETKDEEDEDEDDFFSDEKTREHQTDKIKQKTLAVEGKKNYTVSDWQNAVLVMVSTRLGLKKVQKDYFRSVLYFYMQNFNVGIIGGRPKEAFYFVGLQGEFLIFLDPHVIKDAFGPDIKDIRLNHLRCHEETAKKLHFTKLDPTMTFCFYLRTHDDYRKFETFMEQGKKQFMDEWIFSCKEEKPNYMRKQKINPNQNAEKFEEFRPEEFTPLTTYQPKPTA